MKIFYVPLLHLRNFFQYLLLPCCPGRQTIGFKAIKNSSSLLKALFYKRIFWIHAFCSNSFCIFSTSPTVIPGI